ncbi:TLC domain-containing protein [Entamoeba marina]
MKEDSEPHYLLGMTSLQEFILFICGVSYVYEMTDHIYGLAETGTTFETKYELVHTLPGYIGILFMLYVEQCGGIIIRLLLDSLMSDRYYYVLDDIEEIMFFVSRVCWYSLLSVYGIIVMVLHWDFINKILFVMYCIWTIYVLYDHGYQCFWRTRRHNLYNMYERYRIYLRQKMGLPLDQEEEDLINKLKSD